MNRLLDIATVHMGYTFRGSLKGTARSDIHIARGDTRIIQMKDAWPDKIGDTEAFACAHINHLPAHFPLRTGDLIFRARGKNTKTVLLEKTMPRTICNAPLMFIRVMSQQQVLPAYLNWFINLPRTQKALHAYATGDKIRMISLETMTGLEVLVPTLAAQRHIVDEDSKVRQFMLEQATLLKQAQRNSDDYLWRHATIHLR